MSSLVLSAELYRQALAELGERDADFRRVLDDLGPPAFYVRPPGFPTLIRIILEQQVSLASANATYRKLEQALGEITPESLLTVDAEGLRGVGFSRQKSRYARLLAEEVAGGDLDLEALIGLDDESVRERLIRIPGIGPWSAEIYLLIGLRRADAWPVGDLGVIVGVQQVKGLESRPDRALLEEIGEAWRPWRGVATRLLWHQYLTTASGIGLT